jgi:hypothetical protein
MEISTLLSMETIPMTKLIVFKRVETMAGPTSQATMTIKHISTTTGQLQRTVRTDLMFNDVAPAPPGVPVRNESEFNAPNLVPPLQTFYTVESDYNFTDHTCGEMASVCYPTVAPSSLRLYTSVLFQAGRTTY